MRMRTQHLAQSFRSQTAFARHDFLRPGLARPSSPDIALALGQALRPLPRLSVHLMISVKHFPWDGAGDTKL